MDSHDNHTVRKQLHLLLHTEKIGQEPSGVFGALLQQNLDWQLGRFRFADGSRSLHFAGEISLVVGKLLQARIRMENEPHLQPRRRPELDFLANFRQPGRPDDRAASQDHSEALLFAGRAQEHFCVSCILLLGVRGGRGRRAPDECGGVRPHRAQPLFRRKPDQQDRFGRVRQRHSGADEQKQCYGSAASRVVESSCRDCREFPREGGESSQVFRVLQPAFRLLSRLFQANN